MLAGILKSMRPRQWIKNGVLLGPLLFAKQGTIPAAVLRSLLGVALFSLLASAVYLFNDVLDRERDRMHPEKRHRPIAAGVVPPRLALGLAVVLSAAAVGLSFWLAVPFGWAAALYLVLQLAYSTWLKHVVLLDVFSVAAGFVIRVIAGALVIQVPISHWLYLCTLLLALFLACGKRRAEILALGDSDAAGHRRSLADYSIALLDQLIGILAACTILAYALYAQSPDTIAKFHTDGLKYTVPIVIFGLFRYLYLIHKHGKGGSPEKVLLGDLPILLDVALFVAVVVGVLY